MVILEGVESCLNSENRRHFDDGSLMIFIARFCIALPISGIFPVFFIDYSRPHALQIHVAISYTFFWIIMLALSWYTSPTISVTEMSSSTSPAFARVATLRTRIGRWALIASAGIFMPYLLFASYDFAVKYETEIFVPLISVFGAGLYLYGAVMCPVCRKLNQLSNARCENCGTPLPANFFQNRRDEAGD